VAASVPPTPRPKTLTTVNDVKTIKAGLFFMNKPQNALALDNKVVATCDFPIPLL